jgi:DNA polymerase-3 subunit delta'
MEIVHQLTNQVELTKKQAEETLKQEMRQLYFENLSVYQQHALEKEIEGAISVHVLQESYTILQHLLAWYRDLHVIHLRGSDRYLIHADYKEELEQVVQRGDLLPLSTVQQAIDEAYLALQRSTSFSVCLENLLIKLKWLG